MYQLIFKPIALEMSNDAYLWYEQKRIGLGELFLKELDLYYRKLRSFPTAYSKANKEYRQAALKRFPYVIIFEIMNSTVVIYAVFHTSLSPKEKFKRR